MMRASFIGNPVTCHDSGLLGGSASSGVMHNDRPHSVPPSVSVIVPTYCEAENLPELIQRIGLLRASWGADVELLIMDDKSPDGTPGVVAQAGADWVRLVVRTGERGLSPAVVEGFTLARNEVVVVMDADLSHPPEKIPELVAALNDGAQFTVGSRYAAGGSMDTEWGFLRWVNSQAATLMARPFTSLRDPMSGFFAFRRAVLETCAPLNPIGYKIGLELIVKGRFTEVVEIPIHFTERARGESKLNLREQLLYLRHLRRLADFKYGDLSHFVQFAAVGVSGVVVNLLALTVLWLCSTPIELAVAAAIGVSMLTNFTLNRKITFSYARHRKAWTQLIGFIAGSSLGAVVNYGVTMATLAQVPALHSLPQAASLVGILAGLLFNYGFSRYVVFHKRGQ